MSAKLKRIANGMYERTDTPKRVHLTATFVEKVTKGDKPNAFKEAIREIARSSTHDKDSEE